MRILKTFLLLCLALNMQAIEIPKTGPQYMPTEMEPIVAPFDVSGIRKPAFASRTATVKMNRKGLSTKLSANTLK